MKIKITHDEKGIAYWPDISLEHNGTEYFDPECNIRGQSSLEMLLYMEGIWKSPFPEGNFAEIEIEIKTRKEETP